MNMNKWLENKFSGIRDKFDDLYVIPEQYNFIGFNDLHQYNDFYEDFNDVDIKNNPSYYPNMIENSVANGYFRDVYEDIDMDKILNCTEIYRTLDKQTEKHKINVVIIYPSINRSHCNFLFKMIIKNVKCHTMLLSFACLSFITTNNKKGIIIRKLTLPVMSVGDKSSFYKFCYDSSITRNNNYLNQSHDTTIVQSYKSISKDVLQNLLDKINNEISKYDEYIEQLWYHVIVLYMNSEYKMILNRINDGIHGFMKFNDFMKSLPVFQTMMKIKNRLVASLILINASESTIGHMEILEQQSLE